MDVIRLLRYKIIWRYVKMSRKLRRILVIAVFVFVVSVVSFTAFGNPDKSPHPDFVLELKPPLFVGRAFAGTSPLGEYLDSEVGIAAYYDSGFAINLDNARSAFCTPECTIEDETDDYIIGSVSVPDHLEHFDPHVYVHTSGWILGYYLKSDPIAKIIDVRGKTIDSTLLKTVVSIVASAAGVPFTDVTYYDFRYPDATHMLLVAEDAAVGDNSFIIKIPGSFSYYERGWAVCCSNIANFNLNGVNNPNIVYSASGNKYGTITASQLPTDVDHTVTTSHYGVLIIIYMEP
jgi:hypothetical protein